MNISMMRSAKFGFKAMGLAALLLGSTVVLATTSGGGTTPNSIGAVADTVVGSFASIVKLITAVSYVAGMGFFLAGVMKFKSHRDNPQQVPLSAPIVLVVVAAALLFLPAILQTAGATMFGTSYKQGAGNAGGFTSIQ